MNLEDFVKKGMLNHLKKERRFFEDKSPQREIYYITESKDQGNYEFSYITRNAEKRIESITPHLNDNYVGTINNLSEILLKRMRNIINSKLHTY